MIYIVNANLTNHFSLTKSIIDADELDTQNAANRQISPNANEMKIEIYRFVDLLVKTTRNTEQKMEASNYQTTLNFTSVVAERI